MLDLSKKVELFRRLIWGQAKKESNRDIYEAIDSTAGLIDRRKEEIRQKNQELADHRINLAREKSNRQIALQKEEDRQKKLAAAQVCYMELIDDLEELLLDYSKSQAYRDWLKKDLARLLAEKKLQRLLISSRDRDLISDLNTENLEIGELDSEELGGYIAYLDGDRQRIRASLKARLEDSEYEIGKELTECLNKQ